ncbi:hypothetical protein Pmani_024691 [Petrolisthes manimaculis]|uniref:Phosphatidic acid phosphatase type 2/haloperoxidase domain-containing protein n=1 Tax=Petrolisthes manimaculis TaxID=1843537 RepID=A0AAE1P9T7_9EUCA|nr:hypothetical protein Pmani_024691 [Petrolisthes manimaculis]
MDQSPNDQQPWYLKGFFDVLILILLFLGTLCMNLWATPFNTGFSCKDLSIRYPFKSNPLKSWIIISLTLVIPLLVMIIMELRRWYAKRETTTVNITSRSQQERDSYGTALWNTYCPFLFGYLCVTFITSVGKFMLGRKRPYFVAACIPNWSLVNCSMPYIENIPCTNTDQHLLRESRISFPSGHSSLAWYCTVYLIVYLHVRWSWRGNRLLLGVLHVVCLTLALLTASSRVILNQHHIGDVVGGSLLGILGALMTLWCVSDLQLPTKKSSQ